MLSDFAAMIKIDYCMEHVCYLMATIIRYSFLFYFFNAPFEKPKFAMLLQCSQFFLFVYEALKKLYFVVIIRDCIYI